MLISRLPLALCFCTIALSSAFPVMGLPASKIQAKIAPFPIADRAFDDHLERIYKNVVLINIFRHAFAEPRDFTYCKSEFHRSEGERYVRANTVVKAVNSFLLATESSIIYSTSNIPAASAGATSDYTTDPTALLNRAMQLLPWLNEKNRMNFAAALNNLPEHLAAINPQAKIQAAKVIEATSQGHEQVAKCMAEARIRTQEIESKERAGRTKLEKQQRLQQSLLEKHDFDGAQRIVDQTIPLIETIYGQHNIHIVPELCTSLRIAHSRKAAVSDLNHLMGNIDQIIDSYTPEFITMENNQIVQIPLQFARFADELAKDKHYSQAVERAERLLFKMTIKCGSYKGIDPGVYRICSYLRSIGKDVEVSVLYGQAANYLHIIGRLRQARDVRQKQIDVLKQLGRLAIAPDAQTALEDESKEVQLSEQFWQRIGHR